MKFENWEWFRMIKRQNNYEIFLHMLFLNLFILSVSLHSQNIKTESIKDEVSKKPIINCYYYAPQAHSLLIGHQEKDLKKMVEIGVDIVSFAVRDDELFN